MQMNRPDVLRGFTRSEVRSVKFQSGDPDVDNERHYIEIIALQTDKPNDQNYHFEEVSVESLITSFQAGQPLMFNHSKYGLSGLLFGATVDARYEAPNLIVTAYILLGKGTPNGPYTNTTELKDFVVDGALKDASVMGKLIEGQCSICGLPYERTSVWWDDYAYGETERCSHYRGGRYPVKQANGQDVLETCIVKITEFSVEELSLVWNASDDGAGVIDRNLVMAAMSGSPVDTDKQMALSHALQSQSTPTCHEPTPQPKSTPKGGQSMDVATLQAQKAELEAQKVAKDGEIASLKAQIATLTAEKEAAEGKVKTLEAEKTENESIIADGQKARELAIDRNLTAFGKAHPDLDENALKAEEADQRSFCETLSLEKIEANTKGYEKQAKEFYKDGRQSKEGTEVSGGGPKSKTTSRRSTRGY